MCMLKPIAQIPSSPKRPRRITRTTITRMMCHPNDGHCFNYWKPHRWRWKFCRLSASTVI